jgi:hypothetical protein
VSSPSPSCSSGSSIPRKPSSPSFAITSRGNAALAVPLLGVGAQLGLGELPGQVADLLLFLGHAYS